MMRIRSNDFLQLSHTMHQETICFICICTSANTLWSKQGSCLNKGVYDAKYRPTTCEQYVPQTTCKSKQSHGDSYSGGQTLIDDMHCQVSPRNVQLWKHVSNYFVTD